MGEPHNTLGKSNTNNRSQHLTRGIPRTIRVRENLAVHGQIPHSAGKERLGTIKGGMARPKAHYSMAVKNHVTGDRLKVELVDLPFLEQKRYRVRVNGAWARKVPVASKTIVAKQLRSWLVKH